MDKSAGWTKWLLAIGLLLGAAAFIIFVARRTYFGDYQAKELTFPFERDALNAKPPVDVLKQVFSEQNVEQFENGAGFVAKFTVLNDPRDKQRGKTVKECSLEKEPNGDFDHMDRRAKIKKSRETLQDCINYFQTPLDVRQTVEIGLDDTEGVNPELFQFVHGRINTADAYLTSPERAVDVLLFKLSETDYQNYRSWTIQPGTQLAEAKAMLNRELDRWLLQDTGVKAHSSVATGLFNHLKIEANAQLRHVYIFGDGMENYPSVTEDFYKALYDQHYLREQAWPAIDEKLERLEPIPDLHFAEVTWYFVPHKWPFYRSVQKYWRHLLLDKAHALSMNLVY